MWIDDRRDEANIKAMPQRLIRRTILTMICIRHHRAYTSNRVTGYFIGLKNITRYFCSRRTYVKLLNESQTRKLHMDWPCDVILLENERISWRSIWHFLPNNDVVAITEFIDKLIRSISVRDQQINWRVVFLFNPI